MSWLCSSQESDHPKSWQDLFSLNKCKGGKLGCRALRKDLGKRNPTHIANSFFSGFRDKKKGDEEGDRRMRSSAFLRFKKEIMRYLIMSEYEEPDKTDG